MTPVRVFAPFFPWFHHFRRIRLSDNRHKRRIRVTIRLMTVQLPNGRIQRVDHPAFVRVAGLVSGRSHVAHLRVGLTKRLEFSSKKPLLIYRCFTCAHIWSVPIKPPKAD